jgi:coenzyme F420 hydrogenase subunit beta
MRAGSGGAVTTLLLYMLDEGIVDAVVVAKKVKGLQGEVVVARSRDEVLAAAGSKWSVIPFTLKLKDTLLSSEIRKTAIVGLPCQAQYLYQVKNYPLLETDFSDKIGFIISLFCIGTFATEAFLAYIHRAKGIPPEKIYNIEFKEGKLVVIHEGGELKLSADEALSYTQLGCLICPDYTGVFADLSAGTSEHYPGYTVLITRNSEADKLVREAADKGYLELRKADPIILEELEIKARGKITRAMNYMTKIL